MAVSIINEQASVVARTFGEGVINFKNGLKIYKALL